MASDNDLLEFFTWLKNRGMIVNVFIGEYELIDEYKNIVYSTSELPLIINLTKGVKL